MYNNPRFDDIFKNVPYTYRHVECGWKGTEEEMKADFSGEMYSNHICPKCGAWLQLSDYVKYKEMKVTYKPKCP